MLKIPFEKVETQGLKPGHYKYDRWVFKLVKEFTWFEQEQAQQTCKNMASTDPVDAGMLCLVLSEAQKKVYLVRQLVKPDDIARSSLDAPAPPPPNPTLKPELEPSSSNNTNNKSNTKLPQSQPKFRYRGQSY